MLFAFVVLLIRVCAMDHACAFVPVILRNLWVISTSNFQLILLFVEEKTNLSEQCNLEIRTRGENLCSTY